MIEFIDVVKSYNVGNTALRGVSMQIEDGEFAFLVGPSGSGKSTILKLITGELKPSSGSVHVNGYSLERIRRREIPYLRRTVGVVFQDFRLIHSKTVYDNVAFAMRVIGAREREIRDRVPYVLELVGLDGKGSRHPHELSGGEQQRLAIARALVNNPSTIIKLITGELKPTSGSVHVNGYSLERIRKREAPYLRRTVGVVFQDFRLIPTMTVYENVAFAMRVIGATGKEIRERVPYVLELVGLDTKSRRHPNELSGGEQQRLAIARALVNNPSTIIADEPTGNLDPARSLEIMTLLQEINNLGTTVLVVTHDMKMVERFAKRVISIDEGNIVSDGLDGYYQL